MTTSKQAAEWARRRQKEDPVYHKLRTDAVAAYQKRRHILLKEQLLDIYGRKCACCGESNKGFLTLEHKNGGGSAHRACGEKKYPRTEKAWADAIREKNFEKYEILCFNCNIGKAAHGGVCPHNGGTIEMPEKPSVRYWCDGGKNRPPV